jgi:predicted lipoprotein with Yx(FWY)xxD motif
MNSKLTKTRLMITIAGSAIAIAALAGCSSPATPSANSGSTSGATTAPTTSTDAKTATTSLGKIVVNGAGKTAYFFDKDTANSGASACTGGCASLWPAIESATTTPVVEGITGTVGTIVGTDGGNQITINGRPIYTYTPDAAAGAVTGQGFGGVWWVVSPAGDEVKTAAGSGY